MFIAMNRFRIALGHEEDFEAVWRNRESFLDGVPGFETFHLLKGADHRHAHALCLALGVASRARRSSRGRNRTHFAKRTAQANPRKGTYLGHPELETFESVL